MDIEKFKIEEIFDVLILKHGYDNHNRDYLFQLETNWIDEQGGNYVLRFKDCVDLNCQLNINDFNNLDWGGTAVMAHPGFKEIKESKKAMELSRKVGLKLKEIQLDTPLFRLTLIVSDFYLKKLNDSSELIDQVTYKIE